MNRRRALELIGAGSLVPVLAGCGSDDTLDTIFDLGTTDAGAVLDAGTVADAAVVADAGAADVGVLTGWATGGTASMTAKSSYPDPFTTLTGSCDLICETTIGPCHTDSPERSDISKGWDGIPVRVALRVVDETCTPVSNAMVEIWHTNYIGIYSGEISTMCNTDEEDRQDDYFRGYQTTDADGKVYFDTCFPGWYSSRAIHIHVRVMKGTYDPADNATAWVITQLLFTDELVTAIHTNEALYAAEGLPDTWLSTDNVVGGEEDPSPYVFDVQQMTDGAMLASKTLTIRGSLDDAQCTAEGSANMGGGGMGGPPGDWDGSMPPFDPDGGMGPPPGFDASTPDVGGLDAGTPD